jgi:hypothetical protein
MRLPSLEITKRLSQPNTSGEFTMRIVAGDHFFVRTAKRQLIDAIAEHVPYLVRGDDSTFMNRVHLATAEPERAIRPAATADKRLKAPPAPEPAQAEAAGHADGAPRTYGGALAEGLRRLLGLRSG